ncbi:MAG TPA: serine dehydratase subunit alpha family protein [Candidatus Alectryocaccobium stercorigallinarum]|jgi:L-cysteine desulfidase|nr:serine dehydratase subunit alpha family protein [Candidatus Alectryocaccobium stercorigallinarum]
MDKDLYNKYVRVLQEELITALGCTEPIAIAYASAVARKNLGHMPEKITARCSGNIIKNVKGVTVPNSGGQKGVAIAAILGALGGNPDKRLEVLTSVTKEDIEKSKELKEAGLCTVDLVDGVANLYISLTAEYGNDKVVVEIADKHTNIVKIIKNGESILEKEFVLDHGKNDSGKEFMTVDGILDFAEELNVEDVRGLLEHQIQCNMTIAEEGMSNTYGANVGKNIIKLYGDDNVESRAKAYAAAGSDARMSGCDLAVVVNSGSGNQGITVSVPVYQYAKELKVSDEKLYRALSISNLMSVHIKAGIGPLSAFCGAVSAATGSAAAITYLLGGNRDQIKFAIINTLGSVSGIVCDGAKPSCAAKIASSVDMAILASKMAFSDDCFQNGEGIITDDVESTIKNIGRLGRDGMRSTDKEILNMMIGK